jgi:hypothetical protein
MIQLFKFHYLILIPHIWRRNMEKKTITETVKNVIKKNPNKNLNYIILESIERLHPEIKEMSFKEFKKRAEKKDFANISSVLRSNWKK